MAPAMQTSNDVMLIMERDAESLITLAAVADVLGCDLLQADSLETLQQALAVKRPTVAVLAVDSFESSGLGIFQALADSSTPPATFLVGAVDARVLASIKRAAETRGLKIVGVGGRPLDAVALERIFAAHLTTPPPIARQELEQALAHNELSLQYQPKIALTAAGLRIQGIEALVRWQHPRKGLLHPRHFLHAIEEYDLLAALTDFVMTDAIRQAGRWRSSGLDLELVINLSPRLVRDRGFPERLARLLLEYEFPPERLVLDVTEASAAVDRDLMFDVFTRLRILGVGLSLDNFGTGLSSLTELYRMPYSEIKVDRSLIADVPREREAQLIVRAIADLAHTLQLTACAEGIETRPMLEFARAAGFDTAQGHFFSGPVQAGEIEQLVRAWPGLGTSSTGRWRGMQTLPMDGAATSRSRLPPASPATKAS
jgi:EAL domain-containing protein (putative c-di-GMP-specific phosphodiesterase class I)